MVQFQSAGFADASFPGPLCQQNSPGHRYHRWDVDTAGTGSACPGVTLAAHAQHVQLTCSCYTKCRSKSQNFLSYCQLSVGQPQRVVQKHQDASLHHNPVRFLHSCVKSESQILPLSRVAKFVQRCWESIGWVPEHPDLIKPALSRIFH